MMLASFRLTGSQSFLACAASSADSLLPKRTIPAPLTPRSPSARVRTHDGTIQAREHRQITTCQLQKSPSRGGGSRRTAFRRQLLTDDRHSASMIRARASALPGNAHSNATFLPASAVDAGSAARADPGRNPSALKSCEPADATGSSASSASAEVADASNGGVGGGERDGMSARVVLLLALALALCNADRVIMSMAILPMAEANGWAPSVAGVVQSAFLWGYALTPLAGGAVADCFGGRPVLAAGLLLWSSATLLTPAAAAASSSLLPLLAVRAAMGLGEGVALPCMTSLLAEWVPESQRASATALCFLGFHLGSMAGLLAAPPLMRALPAFGATAPFLVFGLLGFLWLAAWCGGTPAGAPGREGAIPADGLRSNGTGLPAEGTEEEMEEGKKGEWDRRVVWRMMGHSATWAIFIASMTNLFGYFILLSWMPTYFTKVLHVDLSGAAWFAAAPWAVMGAAGILAGSLADWMLHAPPPPDAAGKRHLVLPSLHSVLPSSLSHSLSLSRPFSKAAVRKLMQSVGFLGPCVGLAALSAARRPETASFLLTAVLACSAFSQAGYVLNPKEIAPRHAALLHGIAQMLGTLAGILSTIATGFAVEMFGSFHAILLLTSCIYLLGWVFWMLNSKVSVIIP